MSKSSDFGALPNEILTLIFFHVKDQKWLSFASLVCKRWYKILANKSFWVQYHKTRRSNVPNDIFKNDSIPWQYLASITPDSKFACNLLQNVSGELTTEAEFQAQNSRSLDEEYLMQPWPNYPFWKIWSSAGEGWKVKESLDSERFPICFFTSHYSCTKEQSVDLHQVFQSNPVLFRSDYQVTVYIGQWYKFSGPCTLDVKIDFRDCEENLLDRIEEHRIYRYPGESLGQWRCYEAQKTKCLKGVRYLSFYHGSTCEENFDDEDNRDEIGTCLAQSSLMISFPRPIESI